MPLLYGGAFAAGMAVHALTPASCPIPAVAAALGFVILVAGMLLAVWGKRTMRRAGTNVDPAMPALVLVENGPFRISRNPLYLARTLLYAGLALLANALWPLLALVPLLVLVQRRVIYPEERYMAATFGPAYEAYRGRVRRWI